MKYIPYCALMVIPLCLFLSCGSGIGLADGVGISGISAVTNSNGTVTVTIYGSGFVDGTTVSIDGNDCTSVTVASPSKLTCILANTSIPLINVVVTTPNGGSSGGGWTPTASGYRYFKFVITQIKNGTACTGEAGLNLLRFMWSNSFQSNAMTSNTSGTIGGYTVQLTASSEYDANASAWKALAGDTYNVANRWATAFNIFPGNPGVGTASLTADFGAGISISLNGYQVIGYPANAACSPTAFYLQGSKDGSTWTTICGVQTNQDITSATTYTCAN